MSRARDLSRLSNPTNFTPDATTGRVGLGSISPTSKFAVDGTVTATAFLGDGSGLEGVASAGLGTAISDTAPGDVIYYTNTTLDVNSNVTVDHPSTANVSYTQYQEIAVADGIDFIVSDGDEFIPDVLGLSTTGITPLVGAGGRIRADLFTNKAGTGAPTFQTGVVVTGVATATTFDGDVSGNITGVAATFTGNVSVGGVLTYEDVTNIDSVGLITARTGIKVLAGGINAVGVVTATSFDGSGALLTNLPASGDSNDITACLFI